MNIKFDPNNNIIRLCITGIRLGEKGNVDEAWSMFYKAWNEASDDYDKFIAAYCLARQQKNSNDKLKWMQTSLQDALIINDENTNYRN